MLINRGFELLRSKLPINQRPVESDQEDKQSKLQVYKDRRRCRLTKVDILRLTVEYIKQLTRMLEEPIGEQSSVIDLESLIQLNCHPLASSKCLHTVNNSQQQEVKRRYRARQQHGVANKKVIEGTYDRTINRELIVQWTFGYNAANPNHCSRYLLSWKRSDDNSRTTNDINDQKKSSSKLWIPHTY